MNACTWWIDRLLWWDWSACCRAHDWAYGVGLPQALADTYLGMCVDAVLPGMGFLMWLGVSLLGWVWYALAARRRHFARTAAKK